MCDVHWDMLSSVWKLKQKDKIDLINHVSESIKYELSIILEKNCVNF